MRAVIFIVSELKDGLGGAEKRFAGLWLELQRRGLDVPLVLYESTLQALLKSVEFSEIEKYRSAVFVLPVDRSFTAKHARICEFIKKEVPPEAVCHFVLYYPVFHRLTNPTIFSDVLSNLRMFTLKDHIMTHAAHIRATKIDMLDPQRVKTTRRLLFWDRDKLELTSNTFVDPGVYHAQPASEKKNWIVFLGRFVPVKQIEEFVECIPVLHAACRDAGITDLKFYILGHGVLESNLRALLGKDEFRDIDIEMRYEAHPASILGQAKIGVSLQKATNYPSKSLAEMLASGCVPIVTDVGTTRMIADPSFSSYVPETFSAEELAERAVEILRLSDEAFAFRSAAAVRFAETQLSIGKMAEYYVGLYNDLTREN